MMVGSFRHNIHIEELVETAQDDGDSVRVWNQVTPSDGVFAAIKPWQGREHLAANRMESQTTHRIQMWAFSGLTPSRHRITFGERIFEIISVVDELEMGYKMRVMCKELV